MRERELAVTAILLAVVALSVSAVWSGMGGMGFHMTPWIGHNGWWWMPLGMVLFWAMVGLGLYLLITGFEPRRNESDRALATARERYARGDITAEEFDKIKKNLS